MPVVLYNHALIPPEWIAAHGLRPRFLKPASSVADARAGLCAAADGWSQALAARGRGTAAVVWAYGCDQSRRAAESLLPRAGRPLFIMHVPATWRTETARRLYRDELLRLSTFLVRAGGHAPTPADLLRARRRFDAARRPLRPPPPAARAVTDAPRIGLLGCARTDAATAFLAQLAAAGLDLALDASDSGVRSLPAPLPPEGATGDPLDELVHAFLLTIPTINQRPNDPLFDWLRRQGAAAQLDGWVLLRQPWCDLWHAETPRLRAAADRPLLELDLDRQPAAASLRTRIEAFAELLRAARHAPPTPPP